MAGVGSAIRAGRAFVELFASDNMLYRALDKAAGRLKAFGAMSAKIGGGMGAAGAVLGAPLAKVFTEANDRAAEVKRLADRFGTTTEVVSRLAYAFEQSGVGMEEFGGFLDSLASKVKTAADNNEELIEGLRGLNGRRLLNMSLPQQFDAIANAISRVAVESDRVDVANSFGLGKLIPVLKRGAEGFRELAAESDRVGATVDDATGSRALSTQKEMTKTWQAFKYAILEVGTALIPTAGQIASYGQSARDLIGSVREWIQENRGLVVAVAAVATGLIAGGTALVAFGAVISSIGAVISAAVVMAKLLAAAIMAIPVGVGVATVAVVGLTAAFLTQTEVGQEMTSKLATGFQALKTSAVAAFQDIGEAIGRGDWRGAAELGMAHLKIIWAQTVLTLRSVWNDFKEFFVSGWLKAVDVVSESLIGWAGLWEAVTSRSWEAGAKKVDELMKQVNDMNKEAAAGRAKARAADEAGARAELQRAQDELAGIKQRMANEREAKREAEARKMIPAGLAAHPPGAVSNSINGGTGGVPTMFALSNAAKGIFSGPVSQQLAVGDTTGKRQLDAVIDNTAPLKVLPGMAQDIKGFVAGAKFK